MLCLKRWPSRWQANKLAATGLPVQLIPTALDVIAYRIPSRLGQKPDESRRDAYQSALKLLDNVAAGKFAVEQPAAAVESAEVFVGSNPSFGHRHHSFDKHHEDGI